MKNKITPVIALLGSLAAAQTFAVAQDAPPATAALATPFTVQVIRVEVDRQIAESRQLYVGQSDNFTLVLYIKAPGKTLLKTDQPAKVITKLADDKGTDLTKSATISPGITGHPSNVQRLMSTNLQVTDDGQAAALTIQSGVLPAAGATKITVQGTLAMTCGLHSATDMQKGVALAKDTALNLAGHPAKVAMVENQGGHLSVEFSSSQPLSTIKSLRFLGADGHEIKATRAGSGYSGFTGSETYTVDYSLAEKVDQADIECTYWDKTENITIPINVEAGIGL
jgi:hypothetical protein